MGLYRSVYWFWVNYYIHDGAWNGGFVTNSYSFDLAQTSAFILAFKGIQAAEQDGPLTFGDLFTNSIFRNVVLSLLATLGLYIIASLIFVSHPFRCSEHRSLPCSSNHGI